MHASDARGRARSRTRVVWCAYPWDLLGDPAAVARVRDSGAEGVAIAAAYHSVRAATPLHPGHRIVDARRAALYTPVRDAAWRDLRLRPRGGTEWAGENAFPRAASVARDAGLLVEAWVVLTHSSTVGMSAEDLCVTNAWGETYPYALCPSSTEVRDYAVRLVSEVLASATVDGIMIEACGPLGVGHLGHHEKTQGADWSRVDEALLSICFCAACVAALVSAGADVERLRREVRANVGSGTNAPLAQLLTDATAVLTSRSRSRQDLLRAAASTARTAGVESVTVHASSDPWATGPFAALLGYDHSGNDHSGGAPSRQRGDTSPATLVDAFVLPGQELLDASSDELDALRSNAGELAGYFSALPPATLSSIASTWPASLASVDRAYLYHLGLLSAPRFAAVAAAVERSRQAHKERTEP